MRRLEKLFKFLLVLVAITVCYCGRVLAFTSKYSVSYLGEIDGTAYYDLQTNTGTTLYCLDRGLKYCGGYTYTYSKTYLNKGRACGVIDALKNGEITVSSINSTKNDLSNNTSNYEKLQRYIWNGSENANCESESTRTITNSTSPSGISSITASVSSNELKDNGDGTYITEAISVTTTNSNGSKYKIYLIGAPEGSYVKDSNGNTVTESNSSTLYVVVPSNYRNTDFSLKLVGTYTTTTEKTVYSVYIDSYETKSCPGNTQRLGIIYASSTKKSSSTPINPYTEISFSLPSCIADFNLKKDSNGKVSMEDRIVLYKVYNKRSLLNMSNDTADKACNVEPNCTNTIELGCLSASSQSNGFSANNLSCYSETIDVGTYTGYCGVSFHLSNYFQGSLDFTETYSFGSNFKSGQMVLKRDTPLIALGMITKTCYVYGNVGNSELTSVSNKFYSDYIGDLIFNGEKLSYNAVEKEPVAFNEPAYSQDGTYAKFTQNIIAKYNLKPVYSELGTGKINYEPCDSETNKCKFLGYGFASKLNEANGEQVVQFDLDIKGTLSSSVKAVEKACTYSVNNEIIDNPGEPNGDLNLEFRIIDTNDPFPGKSGNGRKVGENWCAVNPDLTGEGRVNNADSQTLNSAISNGSTSKELDLNKDGKVSEEDHSLLKNIILGRYGSIITGKDCNSNNYYIKYIMNKTNNSYDKNNAGPIYTIELNSATINSIRTYNKTHSYDDYNMECDSNGENCKSLFLEEFEISRNQ